MFMSSAIDWLYIYEGGGSSRGFKDFGGCSKDYLYLANWNVALTTLSISTLVW